jgi:hypothetical protein
MVVDGGLEGLKALNFSDQPPIGQHTSGIARPNAPRWPLFGFSVLAKHRGTTPNRITGTIRTIVNKSRVLPIHV